MSDAQRRLSLLRKDLHEWRDALLAVAAKTTDAPCIKPSDVAEGVERILGLDRGRIGSGAAWTSESPVLRTDSEPRFRMPPTTDVVWVDKA